MSAGWLYMLAYHTGSKYGFGRLPSRQPVGPFGEDLFYTMPVLHSGHCSTACKLVNDKVVGWSLDGNSCAAAPYPALGALEQQVLVKLAPFGVVATTDFLADPNTGVSAVEYGVFQSK